jgi:hypothetical protein
MIGSDDDIIHGFALLTALPDVLNQRLSVDGVERLSGEPSGTPAGRDGNKCKSGVLQECDTRGFARSGARWTVAQTLFFRLSKGRVYAFKKVATQPKVEFVCNQRNTISLGFKVIMKSALLSVVVTTLCTLGATSLNAAEGSSAGVQAFDPAKFPGYVVEEVVVPVPSEIFSVLDKLGEPNWRQELRSVKSTKGSNRTLLALLFGNHVAEGFVAVQAQDKKSVEDIGREVIAVATSLGIKNAVLPHANSILDAADKGDWPAIRKEFDLTQKTVREEMAKRKDSDLAQCVSLGGWLRGTSAVTAVVGKNFSSDRSELLFQPMLLEHFLKQIKAMSADVKSSETIKAIDKGLAQIKAMMDKSAEGVSQESVTSIGKICNDLLKLIVLP